MIDEAVAIRLHISTLQFRLSCLQAIKGLNALAAVFEDRDKWYAVCEGQWPDKFTVLNRFMRTGLRPPFIFND